MSFVKLNDYYVNIEHIIYVQDDGKDLFVIFKDAHGGQMTLTTKKGTAEAASLLKALAEKS